MADLNREIAGFRDALAAHERVVLTEQLPVVESGIDWLLEARHPDGYWGVEDVAETSLCCLAIARWRSSDGPRLLDTSADWLCSQSTDGSWDTNWDSGVALQALLALDRKGDVNVLRGLDRLQDMDPLDDQAWGPYPHHAAQVLSALRDSGVGADGLHSWSKCIARSVAEQEDIYVLSQGVRAILASGTMSPSELDREIGTLTSYLLRQRRPSEGELRSFAPAVEALSFTSDNEALVHDKAATIAGAWSDKRAWYKSPRHAAVALKALHAAGSACEIAVDKPTFNAQFGHAFDRFPIELARERRNAALLGAAFSMLFVIGLLVVALWDRTDSVFVSGLILTILVIAIPSVARALWKGISPLARRK
jgi:hypothetical protein